MNSTNKESETANYADGFDEDIEIFDDETISPGTNQHRPPTEEERKVWQLDKRWSLFMNPRMHGLCFNPWQFLKVDIFSKTNVCCTYFGRLPKFEFVSAKEFHGEKGMWNHPFMQHMRSQNGKKDEVPYCGFCQGRYRQDLPGRTARRLAIIESQKLLQDKMDEVVPFEYQGKLGLLDENLSDWSFGLCFKSGNVWKPFKSLRQFYRRDIRLAGFQDLGDVALFGACLHAYAPFLSEANPALYVLDWQMGKIDLTKQLINALELYNTDFLNFGETTKLPFDDESLDGIWLDARRWLERFQADWLFGEIKRILKPGGRLRVVCAPGSACIVLKIVESKTQSEVEPLLMLLRDETKTRSLDTYFTIEKLYQRLKKMGLVLDKERPPQIKTIGNAFREEPVLGRDLSVIADQLESEQIRADLRKNDTRLNGLEHYISFNCSKKRPMTKQTEISVNITRPGDISIAEFRFKAF